MRDNPNITAEELRKILGISKTAVDNNISFLRENGYCGSIQIFFKVIVPQKFFRYLEPCPD
jgi:biotin operon repressor